MSRILVGLLVVPVLAACNAYAAREGQSISSLQGNADDDQIEYGPVGPVSAIGCVHGCGRDPWSRSSTAGLTR